jgi:hypothetical protein
MALQIPTPTFLSTRESSHNEANPGEGKYPLLLDSSHDRNRRHGEIAERGHVAECLVCKPQFIGESVDDVRAYCRGECAPFSALSAFRRTGRIAPDP